MLADDDAMDSVVFGEIGILANLSKDSIHVCSSTISTALSAKLAEFHAKAEQWYIAAPVFGRPDVAAAGRLFIVAAGSANAIATATPLFDAIGQKTFVVSENAEHSPISSSSVATS